MELTRFKRQISLPGLTLRTKLFPRRFPISNCSLKCALENPSRISIHIEKNKHFGLSFLDVSTGEFFVMLRTKWRTLKDF